MKKETLQFELTAIADAAAALSRMAEDIDPSGEIKELTRALTKEIEEHLATKAEARTLKTTADTFWREAIASSDALKAMTKRFNGLEADMRGTMTTLNREQDSNALLRANIKDLEGTLDNRQLQLRTHEITCKEMESKIKTLESQVADDVNVARLLRAQVRALQEAVADRDQLEDKCKGLEEAVADCIANPAKDDDIKLAREQRDMAYQDIDTLQVANDELRTTLRTLLAVGAGK